MSLCSSISSSYGSHPNLFVNVTAVLATECSLRVLLVLPPHIIVDKFEFPYEHTMWGHSDLELPVHALKDREPTYVMLDAVAEGQGREENHVELVVPLHLRYTEPRSGGGYERVEMAWPMAFSVCPSAHNTPKPSFLDTLPPPFQSPFGGGTHSIMTIPSCTEGGPNPIHEFFIPIGNSDHLPIVQFGTAAFVLFSFFWVGSAILRTLPRQRNGAHSCIIDSKSE